MKLANTLVAIAMTVTPALAQDGPAGNAEEYYSMRFSTAGLLVRAANVCGFDFKRTAKAALKVIRTDEMKAMLRGFPKLTTKWMEGGAHAFNQGVMQDGLSAACAKALEVRADVEGVK